MNRCERSRWWREPKCWNSAVMALLQYIPCRSAIPWVAMLGWVSACLGGDLPPCVPTPRQLAWSAHEFTVFFQFGVNALSDSE